MAAGSGRRYLEVLVEPGDGEIRHLLESAGFLEQVSRARHDFQLPSAGEPPERIVVEIDDLRVEATDDEQGWCGDHSKRISGDAMRPGLTV